MELNTQDWIALVTRLNRLVVRCETQARDLVRLEEALTKLEARIANMEQVGFWRGPYQSNPPTVTGLPPGDQ